MKTLLLSLGLLLLISFLTIAVRAQDCSTYNFPWSSPSQTQVDWTGHGNGDHRGTGYVSGTCTYSGANKAGSCSVKCDSQTTTTASESGVLLNPAVVHTAFSKGAYGGAGSSGPSVTCGGQLAFAARSCVIGFGCDLKITISANANGLGGSVSYDNPTIWDSPTYTYSETCSSELSPGCIQGDEPPFPGGPAGYWMWDTALCDWKWIDFHSGTPIIIDTDGFGFHLTSAANGIKWDFYANHHPIQTAWTEAGSTNGWLALDLNHNGRIDNSRELFGNVTQQGLQEGEDPSHLNGFNALSFYDLNKDGVIDKRDEVWPKLLVWIDTNHDGISQPNELHHLDDMGIHSISLEYTESPVVDAYGNRFRLKGSLNAEKGDDVGRTIYDVYLKQILK